MSNETLVKVFEFMFGLDIVGVEKISNDKYRVESIDVINSKKRFELQKVSESLLKFKHKQLIKVVDNNSNYLYDNSYYDENCLHYDIDRLF
jgi:hypothetical protein